MGACPNARDIWGPALTQAIRAKNERLARELLETGAHPDVRDVWGSALAQARRTRSEQLVLTLIGHGAQL